MHLFLSPHFDDAVLSCGGRIHQLAESGETVVIRTVMGQKPSPERLPDTPIVRELHARWGVSADDAVTRRIQEDTEAARSLGAAAHRMTVWPDCVYRMSRQGKPLYPSTESVFGAVQPDDQAGQLIPTIVLPAREVIHMLYAPLGVGNHVDHQITRDWALTLKKQNPQLALKFYEEYPYSEDKNAVDRALAFFTGRGLTLQTDVVALDETDVVAKTAAVACYESQISTFWSGIDAMQQAIRQFMLRVGSGAPAERCWRVLS